MKNSELQIVVISFSDDFTKNSESLITTLRKISAHEEYPIKRIFHFLSTSMRMTL